MKIRDVHWREAESFAKRRLDRRRKYAIGPRDLYMGGEGDLLLSLVKWVDSCTGCYEGGECGGLDDYYDWHPKHNCRIGEGCSECGHHGVVRQAMWLPAELPSANRTEGVL